MLEMYNLASFRDGEEKYIISLFEMVFGTFEHIFEWC